MQLELITGDAQPVDEHHVKIRFTLSEPGGPAGESLWALPVGHTLYRLANIPFNVYGYAEGDVVRCEYRDGWNEVVELHEDSGNGTIRIIFENSDTPEMQQILDTLGSFGCEYERASDQYFAVTVPPMSEATFVQLSNYLNATPDSVLPGWEVGKWPSGTRDDEDPTVLRNEPFQDADPFDPIAPDDWKALE